MFFKFCRALVITILFFSLPAFAVESVVNPEATLVEAANKMAGKDYQGAVNSATTLPDSAIKDFLLGMAKLKLGDWEKAVPLLGNSAEKLPILMDYSMYNQAYALYRLASYPESLSVLRALLRSKPDSLLARNSEKLLADTLFESGNFAEAIDSYQRFIEKYPSVSDSLDSMYQIAKCSQQMGSIPSAVNTLRSIWLNYPASPYSDKAELDLKKLSEAGARVRPVTTDELMRRGNTLFDLRRYDKAEETFISLLEANQKADVRSRLMLKVGQSRYRQRKYKGTEQILRELLDSSTTREISEEGKMLLAKTLDKLGRDDEAIACYLQLANNSQGSPLADHALLAVYFIKKFQNRKVEALEFLKRIEAKNHRSDLLSTVYWESAVHYYEAGDYKSASAYFRRLLDNKSMREKALFWYSRSTSATGDKLTANNASASLLSEFPYGYYATRVAKGDSRLEWEAPSKMEAPQVDFKDLERCSLLINLGLYDEAKKELNWTRRRNSKNRSLLKGIAGLYLKMTDFHGCSKSIDTANLHPPENGSLSEWLMAFPLAYREAVSVIAAENRISEPLVYSIMRAESNYLPTAVSPAGAIGLMQLMPSTAAVILPAGAFKGNGNKEILMDPKINIKCGVRHLKDILDSFNGDTVLAVAAYNAGSGNVNRWMKRLAGLPSELFIENIPYPETREYVKKVLAVSEIYKRVYNKRKTSPANQPASITASESSPSSPAPGPDTRRTP
jgi:soluble lytic murein transglycosylase